MQTSGKSSLKSWLPRYWWDVGSLARELREGTLTEQDKFAYLFIWLWPGAIAWLLFGWDVEPVDWNPLATTAALAGYVVLIWGVIHSFKINRAGDNRHYMERLSCLMLPCMVRSGVCLGIPSALLLMLTDVAGWDMEVWIWLDPLFYFLFYPAIVWQLCRWMRWVSYGIPVSNSATGDASKP